MKFGDFLIFREFPNFLFELICGMSTIRIIKIDYLCKRFKLIIKSKTLFIMNIVKQNETFSLEETTELYQTSGNLIKDASGTFSIHFHVSRIDGTHLGDCDYNRYSDNTNVSFSMRCAEEVREEFTTYADGVVDSVIAYFN